MSDSSADAPHLSNRIHAVMRTLVPFQRFFTRSAWGQRHAVPDHCDFAFGNPHDMPLSGLVEALRAHAVPQDKDWFAYKQSEAAPRRVLAESLKRQRGVDYDPEDIHLTNGAFATLATTLMALVDPGDEVIFISPPWFFYEPMIVAYGAVPVRVKIDPGTLGLDLAAIQAAITPRTRAIIINSPNNPTGLIYPPDSLRGLADLLTTASANNGRPILLISDEAYCRILYGDAKFHSPTDVYPYSLLTYTYGKTLLAPGQRIGYIALSEAMPDRAALREPLFYAQLMVGYAFPNALLQHAIADLDKLSIDLAQLERKRDRMVAGLREIGYEMHVPDAAFYLMVKSPVADDWVMTTALEERGVYCMPGDVVEMPGYFRISLTASEQMIERSLPRFASALQAVT